jgi:hypothetical protein
LGTSLPVRFGCFLLVASLSGPAFSNAQDSPVGVVLQANLAHVKESAVSEGATVFAGEELSTEVGGSLDLRVADSRFSLAANSRSRFYPGASNSVAELTAGTLTFRKNAGTSALEVVVSDVRIVPKGDGSVTGQVTVFSPCRINVTSVAGELEVSTGNETHVIAEHESFAVLPATSAVAARQYISPDDPAYHDSHSHQACAVPGAPNNSSRFLKIGLIAGAGAIAAILIGSKAGGSHDNAGTESPDKP